MDKIDSKMTKVTEEQLKQVSGGQITPPAEKEKCADCGKYYATRSGYIVKDSNGGIRQDNFRGNLCDVCAEKKLQNRLNEGYTFVRWIGIL